MCGRVSVSKLCMDKLCCMQYACMYVCMYVCMHVCMYGWMDAWVHIYIYMYTKSPADRIFKKHWTTDRIVQNAISKSNR